MVESDERGGLLACGTKSDPDVENYGFVKGHAYTIVLFLLLSSESMKDQ